MSKLIIITTLLPCPAWPSIRRTGDHFFSVIAVVALAGFVLKIGWLLVVGVNEERWYEQANAARGRARHAGRGEGP